MKKEPVTMKCYVLGDAMGATCETTRARESVDDSITEEELENEKDKEQSPTMMETADRIKNELLHCEICDSVIKPGNSMVVITQQTLTFHPPFGFTSQIQVSIRAFQYEAHACHSLMINQQST